MSRTIYFRLLLSFILSVSALWGMAQQAKSTNGVKYQVKFDAGTQRFTVFVVPQYSTPNANNPLSSEYGATAQVTLKLPSGLSISGITNINGDWEEALNPDISGQQEVFRKVRRIEGDYFYVSGNKGLFFKGYGLNLYE